MTTKTFIVNQGIMFLVWGALLSTLLLGITIPKFLFAIAFLIATVSSFIFFEFTVRFRINEVNAKNDREVILQPFAVSEGITFLIWGLFFLTTCLDIITSQLVILIPELEVTMPELEVTMPNFWLAAACLMAALNSLVVVWRALWSALK